MKMITTDYFHISECEVGEYVYIGTSSLGQGEWWREVLGPEEREETVGNQTQKRIWSEGLQ